MPASKNSALVGLAALVALGLGAAPVVAQRHRRVAIPSRAIVDRHFERARAAWSALLAVEVQAGDANGAVRAWDSEWRAALERDSERENVCLGLLAIALEEPARCDLHAIQALLCHPAFDVLSTRRSIFDATTDWRHVGHDGAPRFEREAALAAEADRRGAIGLTCEDLPRAWELTRDRCGRWFTSSGDALVAGEPDRTFESPPLPCPGATSTPDASPPSPTPGVTTTPPEALSPEAVIAVVDRERPALARCWDEGTRGVHDPHAVRLTVAITIGGAGTVIATNVVGDPEQRFSDCIARSVRRWRFPMGTATTTTTMEVSLGPPPE